MKRSQWSGSLCLLLSTACGGVDPTAESVDLAVVADTRVVERVVLRNESPTTTILNASAKRLLPGGDFVGKQFAELRPNASVQWTPPVGTWVDQIRVTRTPVAGQSWEVTSSYHAATRTLTYTFRRLRPPGPPSKYISTEELVRTETVYSDGRTTHVAVNEDPTTTDVEDFNEPSIEDWSEFPVTAQVVPGL